MTTTVWLTNRCAENRYVYRTTALVLQGSVSRGNLADSGKEEVCISHLRRWSDPRGYPLGIGYIRQIWREGDLLLCRGQRPQTSGHLPDGTGQGASCRQPHFQPYSRYPLLDQELSGECGKGCRIYKKRPVPSAPRTHAFPTSGRTQEALPDHHVGRGDARLQSAHDTERCLQRGEELYPQRFRNRLSRLAESRTQHARSDAQGHRMATGTRV